MNTTHILAEAGAVALVLLRVTAASSDWFPPLKGTAACALYIAELVKGFQSHEQDWREFGEYVQSAVACIIRLLPDASKPQEELKQNMEKLRVTLEEISQKIKQKQAKKHQFYEYVKQPKGISDMRAKLDRALSLFQLEFMTTTGLNVSKVLDSIKDLDPKLHLEHVHAKFSAHILSTVALNARIDKLQVAEGASWTPARACLPDTRTALLAKIWQWINSPTGSVLDATNATDPIKIFLLTSVAGAGKSAIANTIAQYCYKKHFLASSFFFDRNSTDRPKKLFSTIAQGLAAHDVGFRQEIGRAIELDEGLSIAHVARQFQELVLAPSQNHSVEGPLVIVIDALDECYDQDVLDILCDEIHKLPPTFRILFTSRNGQDLNSVLSQNKCVYSQSIVIGEPINQKDIAVFVCFKLKKIAEWKSLGKNWPGEELLAAFTEKAEGLFLWVSTVCEYLRESLDPDEELKSIISNHSSSDLPAEEKMDELYLTILQSCNWKDRAFTKGYNLLMGAIMAAKTPLSASALQALHGNSLKLSVKKYLHPVSSVLTGVLHPKKPIQPLHLSFRDFITIRAQNSLKSKQFYIDEKKNSQRLAYLCLAVMDKNFPLIASSLGYLTVQSKSAGIPVLSEELISEEMWYSCRFWIDHLLVVDDPNTALIGALQNFFASHLVSWVEILSAKGRFRGLWKVTNWIQKTFQDDSKAKGLMLKPEHGKAFFQASACLSYMDRKEEALKAIQEALKIYEQLATHEPSKFNPDVAISLNTLSTCLADLGHREKALEMVCMAIKLDRCLATDHPTAFNPTLAVHLNNLSLCLSNLGNRDEALKTAEEANELCQQLAKSHPTTFNPDLAVSMHRLSLCLTDLGNRKEALKAIQEAVEIRQQLATDQPTVFTPVLTKSLTKLSKCLSDLGQREKALEAIEKAVKLHRQLANDHPAAFNPDLALSVHRLSRCLSEVGQRKEALKAIQEAVEIRQQLSNVRPAAFNPVLAKSLTKLSNYLSDLGHREEALIAAQKAVNLHRQLAKEHPAAFNPGLALSVHRLSLCLSDMGQRNNALKAIREAVEIRQHLASNNPAAFNHFLAASLTKLSNCLSHLGHQEEALEATQEAVDICQQLVKNHPAAFNPDLAVATQRLSNCLSNLGHHEEALKAIQETVALRKKLAIDHPDAFIPVLTKSLIAQSQCFSNLGHPIEALKAAQEAVELHQQLGSDYPAIFNNSSLARSLIKLSNCLSELGHHEPALEAAQKANKLLQQLAEDHPAAFSPNFAKATHRLSICLSDLGHQEEALEVIQEAIKLRRQLAKDYPATFNIDLAASVRRLSQYLLELGHRDEALEAVQEAVELSQQFSNDHPAAFNPILAKSLATLDKILSERGQLSEAL